MTHKKYVCFNHCIIVQKLSKINYKNDKLLFLYNSTNLELICPLYIKKDIICCALFYLFVFLVQNDWLLGYLLFFFYFLFIIIRFRYFLMGLLFCNILLKSRETIKFSKNYLKICFNLSQKFFLLNVFLFVDIIILFNYYCI